MKTAGGKIYVTGANGRLGRRVLRLIPNAIPLVRRKTGLFHERITDFSVENLEDILKGARAVIHLAGSTDFTNEKELRRTNVALTARIDMAAAPKTKIVLASSISVYGKKLAKIPANEETHAKPDSAYAHSKYDAERIVKKHGNAVILRIGTVYGPGFDDYYRILGMIEHGRMRIFGNGLNRVSFVHVDDVAKAVANAVKAKDGVYVVAGESLPQLQIYAVAAKALGVKAPHRHVPRWFGLALARFEELKAHIGKHRPKLTREHINILTSDRVFDFSRAKRHLGFKPRNLKEGIKEMVKEYKKNVLKRG
jgi:dihydroflavonol-4-reductase